MQGAWGGIPSLGTLEDSFGRSPNAGNSLYGRPFMDEEPGMGSSYAHFFDGCMNKGYSGGVPLCEGLH
jgi:hypothetical protein